MRSLLGVGMYLLLNASICVPHVLGGDPELSNIDLPEGFQISVFARNVKNARAMCWGDDGTLYVGSRSAGVVSAVRDLDGDGLAEDVQVIARGLNMPAGVAFRNGDLYISAVDRVVRLEKIGSRIGDPPAPVTVVDGYPSEKHHGWKFIAFGPDGSLYIPVGAPCNICLSEDRIFATITRMDLLQGTREIVAHGVRNTVGFDWHPTTGELWFTDNGRDWMGDDTPPCELNRLTQAGAHFGYPFCHGRTIPDPEFGDRRSCDEFVPPVLELQAHSAPLGMRFYTGTQFPERYRNAIFIAQHGSWNRSTPVGYAVVAAFQQPDGSVVQEPFATGWLQGSKASGRPVDVLQAPDGSLLVSDDSGDLIYRISYQP
jgi:glucose/arabinose dehydrogenase